MGAFFSGALQGYSSTAMAGKQAGMKKRPKTTSDAIKGGSAHVDMPDDDPRKRMLSYKRGGKVRKTGAARLHKGERVLTAKQAKRFDMKKMKKRHGRSRGGKRR